MSLEVDRTGGPVDESEAPDWLAQAEAVKRCTPDTPVYRHRKRAGASVERVSELAGIIHLDGPVPSTDFLEE